MARRRSGSAGGWSTTTYRGPLWKYTHPLAYLGSEYRKAKRAMHPKRVAVRVLSLDEVAKATRTQTKRVNAQTRQAQVQRATKQAAKKAADGKADPYAVARGIPQQNRQAAAKLAKATQPAAKKTVAKRKTDGSGRFDGSKSMTDRDRGAYERARAGYVDPVLRPRGARRAR